MSTQASGSQSSDGGEKEPTSITFHMHRGIAHPKTGLGVFHLEMPSSEGLSKTKNNQYAPIVLEIKDEDQMGSLKRMKLLNHENILAMHFFDKDEAGGVRAYVEQYAGSISELFHAEYFVNLDTKVVPSPVFQEFVSASLSALDYIIKNDSYHGNFSWETTLYHQERNGKKILKLSNFEERKNIGLQECQVGDCHGLAHSLEVVSLHVKNNYTDVHPETCCLIDDLARRLRAVTIQSLSTMKQKNENHAFFWDDKRKRTFYANEIPIAWEKPAFLQRFQSCSSAPTMPWDQSWKGDRFMKEMEIYREANGIQKYNFEEIKDFIRYISGLYTHELEISKKANRTVDAAVHAKHPRLLLDLQNATEANVDE